MNKQFRHNAIRALSIVLKSAQNVKVFEMLIYQNSSEEEYRNNILQLIYDIRDNKPLNELYEQILNKNIGWKHPNMKEFIFEEFENDNFIMKPFEVEEGIQQCSCGSKRVFSYQKQVRSADEPMSLFSTCCACGKKWSYSG